jgi:hypothetical protein
VVGEVQALSVPAAAGTLSYNSGNQITTSGYGYDGAGNQATDHRNGALAYNDAGQMTTAATPANGPEHLSYAGDTQSQVLSDGTATAITYGLAGPGGQPWVQSYIPATAGSPPAYVLHDQQGTPLAMTRGGSVYAYVPDNTGSVTALIDTSGNTAASYAYDPYGNTTATSGAQATINLIGYTGALTDPGLPASSGTPSTGYTHLGQRWQNPATGAFTTQDTSNLLAKPRQRQPLRLRRRQPHQQHRPHRSRRKCVPMEGGYLVRWNRHSCWVCPCGSTNSQHNSWSRHRIGWNLGRRGCMLIWAHGRRVRVGPARRVTHGPGGAMVTRAVAPGLE